MSNFELLKLETFKISISLTLELSSSAGCFKLKLQTFAAVEFDRPSKFESLRLRDLESLHFREFDGFKL